MSRHFEFDCPNCEARTVVDREVRELVMLDGCIVCGEPIDEGAFARVEN
ncbi:DUF7560 family zinc ribbon protein [Haloarchaeobius sp. TZWSO28]